jgi:L-seryl-tRNA(Ser) seleniumtransferase
LEEERQRLLRNLPSVDEVVRALRGRALDEAPEGLALDLVREVLAKRREAILSAASPEELRGIDLGPEAILEETKKAIELALRPHLRRVINATGVILHTNLGRAPLGGGALRALAELAGGYCNLEYDLSTGRRGHRDAPLQTLLRRLTGCEAATVVNNNAAAVLLCLRALAKGRKVIVSRGELVEVGGGFRIPDVMRESGALLKEVGTTNKTRLQDYAEALDEETALLLKVHTSNYRIVGFAEEVSLEELSRLGREGGVPVMMDLGSGCLLDLRPHGLSYEPTPADAHRAGADLVTISGDKLLGGRQGLVDQVRRHPLMRALRVDKMTLTALEQTLLAYLDPDALAQKVPALRMLFQSVGGLRRRARRLVRRMSEGAHLRLRPEVQEGTSRVGGGSLPTEEIPTVLIALKPADISLQALEESLRSQEPPVIARVQEDSLLLDLRTVSPREEPLLLGALEAVLRELR